MLHDRPAFMDAADATAEVESQSRAAWEEAAADFRSTGMSAQHMPQQKLVHKSRNRAGQS